MFNETEATKSRPSAATWPSPASRGAHGCQSYREAQVGDTCRHCYRCGQEGHFSQGCRQNRFPQGNRRMLLSRDPQYPHPRARSQAKHVSLQSTASPFQKTLSDHTDTLSTPHSDSDKPRSDPPSGYVPSQRQTKFISLMGSRCMVQCHIDNMPVEVLWDTRAGKQHLPHSTVRPLSELSGAEPLVAVAANGSEIPYDGWIETTFYLDCDTHPEKIFNLQELLNSGWISESRSLYSSPIICVRKKSGELRLCCDYRELNKKSVPDRLPIPRI